MPRIKLALVLVVLFCVGSAGKAHAWVQFCNATDVAISTAYSWWQPSCVAEDGSSWAKAGWWNLAPGQCAIVYGPDISNPFSYYYAEGGGRVWGGPFFTCTPFSPFNWCDNTCSTDSRNLGYGELNSGGSSNYTLTFTR